MRYPCVRPYILFYIHSPAILHFFQLRKYHKITQIQIVGSQKLTRSFADIAEHICKIERRSVGNFFLKRANISWLVAIVIKGLVKWGSKCNKNNSPMVCDGYVKYKEA